MNSTITDERLKEILDGCEGVTPGDWETWRAPSGEWTVRAVYLDEMGRRNTAWPAVCNAGAQDNETNASHLSRLDPATVAAMASELLAAREALSARVEQVCPGAGEVQRERPCGNLLLPERAQGQSNTIATLSATPPTVNSGDKTR